LIGKSLTLSCVSVPPRVALVISISGSASPENCYLFRHLAGFQRGVHAPLGRDVHLYAAGDRG